MRAMHPFCSETYSQCMGGWQRLSIAIYTFTITVLEKDREQVVFLQGWFLLGVCVITEEGTQTGVLGKDWSLLNFVLELIGDLQIIHRQFVSPFPEGPNLRCNFCSCQSFFLSPRPFCKNPSCSEESFPFINSETERRRAGRGLLLRWKEEEWEAGNQVFPNKPSFQWELELEVYVR